MGCRVVRMNGQLFADLFVEGVVWPNAAGCRLRVTKGLPKDARLVAVSNQLFFMTGEVALKFQSAEWPDVPPGYETPEVRVEWTWEELPPPVLTDKEREELERLRAVVWHARRVLTDVGYFTPEEVGEDIAPRITELLDAIGSGQFSPWRGSPKDMDYAQPLAAGMQSQAVLDAIDESRRQAFENGVRTKSPRETPPDSDPPHVVTE